MTQIVKWYCNVLASLRSVIERPSPLPNAETRVATAGSDKSLTTKIYHVEIKIVEGIHTQIVKRARRKQPSIYKALR